MKYLILTGALLLWGCDKKDDGHKHEHPKGPSNPAADAGKLDDPVCGMKVAPADAKATRESGGKKFGFCSDACLKKYDADPKKFAQGFCDCALVTKGKPCGCGHCKDKPSGCDCN